MMSNVFHILNLSLEDTQYELKELMKTNPSLAKERALKSLLATGMCDEDGNFIGLEKLNE